MKNLIQYNHACMLIMYHYMQKKIDLNDLISKLKAIENSHKGKFNEQDENKSFWFRFFPGDTTVTTINDIKNCLSLPKSHTNYGYMQEKIEIGVQNKTLEVYFS